MKMTPKEYQEYVKNKQEKSPMGKDMLLSFLVSGEVKVCSVSNAPKLSPSKREEEFDICCCI